MTLEEAVFWAKRTKFKWELNRGQVVEDIWHVVKWNGGYMVITDEKFKKHKGFWISVYNTKDKIVYGSK